MIFNQNEFIEKKLENNWEFAGEVLKQDKTYLCKEGITLSVTSDKVRMSRNGKDWSDYIMVKK